MPIEFTVANFEERRLAGRKWVFGPFLPKDSEYHTEALEIGYVNLHEVESTDRLHFHSKTEEYYVVLAGHLTIQVADRFVEVPEGSILLVRPGYPHIITAIHPGT